MSRLPIALWLCHQGGFNVSGVIKAKSSIHHIDHRLSSGNLGRRSIAHHGCRSATLQPLDAHIARVKSEPRLFLHKSGVCQGAQFRAQPRAWYGAVKLGFIHGLCERLERSAKDGMAIERVAKECPRYGNDPDPDNHTKHAYDLIGRIELLLPATTQLDGPAYYKMQVDIAFRRDVPVDVMPGAGALLQENADVNFRPDRSTPDQESCELVVRYPDVLRRTGSGKRLRANAYLDTDDGVKEPPVLETD